MANFARDVLLLMNLLKFWDKEGHTEMIILQFGIIEWEDQP